MTEILINAVKKVWDSDLIAPCSFTLRHFTCGKESPVPTGEKVGFIRKPVWIRWRRKMVRGQAVDQNLAVQKFEMCITWL